MARIKLADFIERTYADASTVIELPDGTTVTMPPGDLWPDAAFTAAREGNIRDCVILTLGEPEYERFCQAGGNWRILNAIIAEQQGLTAGESSASSQSSESSATPSKPTSSATTKSTSRKRSAPRR